MRDLCINDKTKILHWLQKAALIQFPPRRRSVLVAVLKKRECKIFRENTIIQIDFPWMTAGGSVYASDGHYFLNPLIYFHDHSWSDLEKEFFQFKAINFHRAHVWGGVCLGRAKPRWSSDFDVNLLADLFWNTAFVISEHDFKIMKTEGIGTFLERVDWNVDFFSSDAFALEHWYSLKDGIKEVRTRFRASLVGNHYV